MKGFVLAQIGSDFGRDDFAGRQRRAIVHRHDPDQVVIGRQDDRREAPAIGDGLLHVVENAAFLFAQRMAVNAIVGDDGELGRVDRVRALTQDLSLRAFLATAEQEFSRVLIVRLFFRVVGAKHLRRRKRRAVACEHVGNLALPDRDQIGFVDSIHEREKQMQAAAQHFRLVAGLAVQRDESALDRAFCRPQLFDNADLIVRDVAKDIGNAQQDDNRDRCRGPKGRLDQAKAT